MKGFEKILDIIIPRKCAGCGARGEIFCGACRNNSLKRSAGCLFCGFRNNTGEFCVDCKRKFKPILSKVIWAGNYDAELKKAILVLKYGKRKEMTEPLGGMLAEKFLEHFANLPQSSILEGLAQRDGASRAIRQQADMRVLQNAAIANKFIAIPIPLHFKRRYERGFNQAELLALEFSKITGITVKNNILEKIKETPAQVEVRDKELRLKNLEGVFRVKPPLNPLLGKEGKCVVILIDDVSTTGATLMHAAGALKKAGVKNIIGLVVAHG